VWEISLVVRAVAHVDSLDGSRALAALMWATSTTLRIVAAAVDLFGRTNHNGNRRGVLTAARARAAPPRGRGALGRFVGSADGDRFARPAPG